jgi:nucleoid-associated protein YgaU
MCEIYIVKKGDTLSEIAERIYGNWKRGTRIYMENMTLIKDDPRNAICIEKFGGIPPDWIFPDQVLKLLAR